MAKKQQPIGVCDHPDCLARIPRERWYTTKGKPRMYCSRRCQNTANSRAGANIRSEKAKKRIAAGQWQNPAKLNPPDPAKVGAGVSQARKLEVEAGEWRNPALSLAARKKLSRPRKHSGVLHRAIEKLGQGYKVSDLTEAEAEAHRKYRRELYAANRQEKRAWYRRWWRKRWAAMSEEEREVQRAKWREQNRKRAKLNKTR